MNGKHNHSGLYLIKYIGEFKVLIPAMNIAQAIADLYFRRKYKTGEEKIKTNSKLRTKIVLANFYQVIPSFRPGITRHINIRLKTWQCVHSKILFESETT